MNTRLHGRWGESIAAEYLKSQGYTVRAMGYSSRFGEIDIIASGHGYLTFVEVKTRKSDKFAKGREFVDRRKQEKIILTASFWIEENTVDLQPRFDVIEIYAPDGIKTQNPKINHIIDAFS